MHGLTTDSRLAVNEQRSALPSQMSVDAAMETLAAAQNVGIISKHPTDHPRGPSPSFSGAPSPGITTSASNAATVLGGMNSRLDGLDALSGPGQVNEFHHAMTYINRIKTRFVDNQEVYKEFLQLLQAYQKEQMNIQEVCLFYSVI
jgi:paired amphipathic helix protein Sin3a